MFHHTNILIGRLGSTLGVVAFVLFAHQASAQQSATNVLFIGVDDLRIELGCYGASHMHTPHIDALASQGVLFEHAYCQQAVCAASRISLMTGLRPDTTGVFDLDHPLDATLPEAVSLANLFYQNGYRTISLGKIYHHGQDDKANWSVLDSCSRPGYADPATVRQIQMLGREARTQGLQGKALRLFTKGPAYESADVSDDAYSDGVIADRAIEELGRMGDHPFFLAVGFKKPHLPFVAPKKYWDLYDRNEIAIPSREAPENIPPEATTTWGELRSYDNMPEQGDCSDEQTRTLIHGYRACVSYVDYQIGRVLKKLDELQLADSTLVVLWGDHGWKLGEYGDWCKHTNFELDTHVPLIFRGPGVAPGSRSDALVEYVDIYPTLAKSCGLEPPAECEGADMNALFADPSCDWKQFAMSQYPRRGAMGYSIRHANWRYTQWRRRDGTINAEELYDHQHSDVAIRNLAGAEEHAETLESLRDLLDQVR
ncbi:MAG: sulfatase [Planctomycetota bacterium]